MPYRLTKIYTRKGDEGYTTLGDHRISKDEPLVEAIGTIDELNSSIGMILAFKPKADISTLLTKIQNELFDLGGELHLPQYSKINEDHVKRLETQLDQLNESLPPLQEFILPGGNPASAATHVARTICRRAERVLVHLHRQVALDNKQLIRYINRLSDLLFVIARVLARETEATEQQWEHEREKNKN